MTTIASTDDHAPNTSSFTPCDEVFESRTRMPETRGRVGYLGMSEPMPLREKTAQVESPDPIAFLGLPSESMRSVKSTRS